MNTGLKKILFSALTLSKGEPFRSLYSGKVQVLMLHRVVDQPGKGRISNDGIEITKEYLEFLIGFYRDNGFTEISIGDLPNALKEKSRKRYVVYTFDDGYLDNYTLALPVFKKYNIPFAVYIPLDYIKRKQFGWWYLLENLVRSQSVITYTDRQNRKTTHSPPHRNAEELFASLRLAIQQKPAVLQEIVQNTSIPLQPYYDLFLNEEQLKEFAKEPLVTIGSHSITHPSLAHLSDEESFFEINESKKELEKLLGKRIDHFSYPFGTVNDVSEKDRKNVEKAGYLTALTTAYGDVYTTSDLLLLPRIWTSTLNQLPELRKSIYGVNAYHLRK